MTELTAARILIVDDEARHMKALCDTLRDHGSGVSGFTAPSEALIALENQQFDVLLTDLMMPEMSGIELLRAAMKIDPHIVGIMMTGYGTIDTAVEAMQAGAHDYILKPFKLNAILPVLSRALSVRKLKLENEELQRNVRQRSAELEAANKELEAFSYSISHDLRSPLRAISGFSRILKEDFVEQLPSECHELLGKVNNNVRRMAQLIDDLLEFSRLSREPLSKRSVNTFELVHEVLEELRCQSVRSVAVCVETLPECFADPLLLRQVFVNLLSNAYKFTRSQEHPTIKVGYLTHNDEQTYFVRDNGVGFDMRYADRLFGAFQRLHSRDEFEGSGIGLSIANRIVRRHGGRIWAESEREKGATFYFTLAADVLNN